MKTILKRWIVVRRPEQDHKRIAPASDDGYLALTVRRYRKSTARQLISELVAATGIAVSRQTIYRRLNKSGLYARKPMVCVLLSSQKKREALIDAKHIRTRVNTNGPMFYLLMSRSNFKHVYILRDSGT